MDYGLDYGLDFGLSWTVNSVLELLLKEDFESWILRRVEDCLTVKTDMCAAISKTGWLV